MSGVGPNLFVVGAAKAGTTSLYRYLAQHPEIYMSPVKEPHYFSDVRPTRAQSHLVSAVASEDEYLRLFERGAGFRFRGEASTSYLWSPVAPERIRRATDDARIIALLRDPVKRAFSHYLMDVKEGLQGRPFLQALEEDMAAPQKGWGVSHLYVELGLYAEQLARYQRTFGERRVLVLFNEELRRSRVAVLDRVASFLELDPSPFRAADTATEHNTFGKPRGELARRVMGMVPLRRMARRYAPAGVRAWVRRRLLTEGPKPEMGAEAQALLAEIYGAERARLERMLTVPLPWA